LLRKLLKKQGFAPRRITTDKLKSYPIAIRKERILAFHDPVYRVVKTASLHAGGNDNLKKRRLIISELVVEWPMATVLVSVVAVLVIGDRRFSTILDPAVLAVFFVWLFAVILAGVICVARHAEALAELYGEPLGTIILTLTLVGIEVVMIASILFHDDPTPEIARDTLYSSLMIIVNGFLGLAVLVGGLKHGVQRYNLQSSRIYLSMLLALWGIAFFIPSYLPAAALNSFKGFLILLCVVLYGLFLRVQFIQHRYFFSSGPGSNRRTIKSKNKPTNARQRMNMRRFHFAAVIITFAAVAFLSKFMAEVMDEGVQLLRLPPMLAPLAVAILVLSPKAIEAVNAALANDVQRAVNIGLGAALGTVALTVPVMLTIGFVVGQPITLALTTVQQVIVALTIMIAINNYKDGDVNIMAGTVQFALFSAFIATILITG